jgi:hypothetical protein
MKGSSPETQLAGFLAKYTTAFFFYGTTGFLSSDEEYDGSLLRISPIGTGLIERFIEGNM